MMGEYDGGQGEPCGFESDKSEPVMRTFGTGATRGADTGKLDYEGFLCPFVLERYAQYLNEHRIQADGEPRQADNWQKGIPKREYIKSLIRHTIDFWKAWRRGDTLPKQTQDLVCGIVFNAMGWLHEDLKTFRLNRESMKSPAGPVWTGERRPAHIERQMKEAGDAKTKAVLDPEEVGHDPKGLRYSQ